jgi:hypothetical protein
MHAVQRPPGTRAALGVLLAVVAWALPLGATPAASAAPATRAAEILRPNGSARLKTGGSGTPFAFALPQGAACPGDTAHKFFLLDSYVLPATTNPGTVSFRGGVPKQGTDLVAVDGEPYEAVNTAENTGAIPGLPTFSWAAYAHHLNILGAKTFNFGIMCANRYGAATTYWNAEVAFTASSTDPGGFTWTVIGVPKATSGGTSVATVAGVAIGVAAVGGVLALVWSRRRPARATAQTV